jgi:transposase-like protein
MKKNRTYTNDFKRGLISQIESGEITLAAAARNHDISPSLIDYWRKRIHSGTLQERPTALEKQQARELEQYKKKVGELTLQIDLLKKINENSAFLRRRDSSVVTIKNWGPSERRVV